MLIHLLTEAKRYKDAIAIQEDSERVIENKEIKSKDLIDLYLVLIKLYQVKEQKDLEKLYKQKLSEKETEAPGYESYYKAS